VKELMYQGLPMKLDVLLRLLGQILNQVDEDYVDTCGNPDNVDRALLLLQRMRDLYHSPMLLPLRDTMSHMVVQGFNTSFQAEVARVKRTKSLKRQRSSRGGKGVRSMKGRGARGEERKGPVLKRINSI